MALIWKRHKSINSGHNFVDDPVGGGEIVSANELPNLIKIKAGFRMEIIGDHEPCGALRAAALFSRKCATTSSREMGFTRPLFRSS